MSGPAQVALVESSAMPPSDGRGVPSKPRGGARAGFARLSTATRVTIVGGLVVGVLAFAVRFTDGATRSTKNDWRGSSTLSTGPTGAAALRELLATYDVDVSDQRGPIEPFALDADATFVMLDGVSPDPEEIEEIQRFVVDGGRVVIAGDVSWAEPIWGGTVPNRSLTPDGPTRETPTEAIIDVNVGAERFRVISDDRYTFRKNETGDGPAELSVSSAVEHGEVRLIASESLFRNELLAREENAAFALTVVGTDRPVVFAEGIHGVGRVSGLDAIPSRWRVALVGGTLAVLLTLLAKGRRLGPPEVLRRPLVPSRLAYVDAMGALLRRTKHADDALAPVVARLRAAHEFGKISLTPDEQAVFTLAPDRTRTLAVGQILSRVGSAGLAPPTDSVLPRPTSVTARAMAVNSTEQPA